MSEEIYGWAKNLAVFYILFTALLHLVPSGKYEKYVRFFMGLLLILMLSTPVFSIIGKSGELIENFQVHYELETAVREQEELENLQEFYLEKGYEQEAKAKIIEELKKEGIEVADAAVKINGGELEVVLYLQEFPNELQERRIADGLYTACQIGEGQYQVKVAEPGLAAVGSPVTAGDIIGSGGSPGS